MAILKQEYKPEIKIKDALSLSMKVLHKTLDVSKLSAEKGKH